MRKESTAPGAAESQFSETERYHPHTIQDPLEQLAAESAASQKDVISSTEKPVLAQEPLTAYLKAYAAQVEQAVTYYRGKSEQEQDLPYSAEWILDNAHIIQQALREVREDLPGSFYHQLPKLTQGTLAGFPRVYSLANALISFEKIQLNPDRLRRFVETYQETTPLTMGELWAIPLMLRLAIIQCLAQALYHLTRSAGQSQPTWPAVIDLPIEISHDEVVANSITSLRWIASADWKVFFESVSLVEAVLRTDPAGLYPGMDFNTRDQYRKAVEKLAFQGKVAEEKIAKEAVRFAQQSVETQPGNGSTTGVWVTPDESTPPGLGPSNKNWDGFRMPRQAHVGTYLLDRSQADLRDSLQIRFSPAGRMREWVLSHPTLVYVGSIAVLVSLFILLLFVFMPGLEGSLASVLGVAVIALIPAMTLAVDLVNLIITKTLQPRILAKMDFSDGIPADCATLVAVPALLSDHDELDSLLQQLEMHFLSNPYPNLYFALLTDFADAPEQHMAEDELMLSAAQERIRALNDKYSRSHPYKPFFWLHRERRWNPKENAWIGWERKRGKLEELSCLILDQGATSFVVQEGDLEPLTSMRYVITLDADTVLPRESAPRLIATLAHPLNRAEFDPKSGELRAGYTLLQPRIEISPTSSHQSRFTKIFSGASGLDLYTLAISDVYQDLFGEGIYVGKGIYDVSAFSRSLEGRVPENALLSHDLFEGLHGRAGLVTDIVLIEDMPPNYLVHIRRSHRWIRGDWQLLPWLGWKVPGKDGQTVSSRFSVIDRWKIIDNLRRSLVAPALILLFLAGWLWLPGDPLAWTLVGMLSIGVQMLSGLLAEPGRKLNRLQSLWRWLLALAYLPYEALLNLNAILLSLNRVWFTRRQMLQWTTAADTARQVGEDLHPALTWKEMMPSVLLSAAIGLLVIVFNPQVLPVAAPILLLWLLSPLIVYWNSRPVEKEVQQISVDDEVKLRRLARRTWLFFEQYLGPEDHWLPPDNYQETPLGVVAHRTSPTNIGLTLLSTLAAYDLGYVGLLDLAARLRASFETLREMERYQGHFLNWYDTRTLEPLLPRYVSTVDSGNLAAALVALAQACQDLNEQRIWRWEIWQGAIDLISLLVELLDDVDGSTPRSAAAELRKYLQLVEQELEAARNHPDVWLPYLLALTSETESPPDLPFSRLDLDRRFIALVESGTLSQDAGQLHSFRLYVERLHRHLDTTRREVELLLPWLTYAYNPPVFFRQHPLGSDLWASLDDFLAFSTGEPSLKMVSESRQHWLPVLAQLQEKISTLEEPADGAVTEASEWLRRLYQSIESAAMSAKALQIGVLEIENLCNAYVNEMDFRFLYHPNRMVFHIGYNLETGHLDNNYYDLLASEARIASLVAIAKGDVPQRHWLHLGRPFTRIDGTQALVSWSATMFEYLMPRLMVRSYEGTLLAQTIQGAVDFQIAYGEKNKVPWGISESGFYRFDINQFYQYRAFGVPGLGYKRGLGDDMVITPYASLLALPLRPRLVVDNLDRLSRLGMVGPYGLYEAIDFTSQRLPLGEDYQIVYSYMAHHQSMIFISLANWFTGDRMVERFHADARIKSVELLLQEQIPSEPPYEQPHAGDGRVVAQPRPRVRLIPWQVPLNTPWPQAHYLSNGLYGVLITNAGTGYSQWSQVDLTRWRPDTTLNEWGNYLYVKDIDSGQVWSAAHQPTVVSSNARQVSFNAHMVEFTRRDADISTTMELTVAPDADVEVRRITLTNHSERTRRLSLVSYGEVILASQANDQRHPAFNKLFIESSYIPEINALLFRRRPRSEDESPVFMAHLALSQPGMTVQGSFDSDRAQFLGRGNTPRSPLALMPGQPGLPGLVEASGPTLDPIFALEQQVELQPGETKQLAFLSMAAGSAEEIYALAGQFRSWEAIDYAFSQAHTRAELELRRLGLDNGMLEQIQQIFSALLYPHQALRADPGTLAANQKAQPSLWAYGISGDHPILLAEVATVDHLSLVHQLLQAHAYWRKRNIKIDLVVLNTRGSDYGGELNNRLMRLVHRRDSEAWLMARGGIFILSIDRINKADLVLLRSAARVILSGERGSIADHLGSLPQLPAPLPPFIPFTRDPRLTEETVPVERPDGLLFDNGLGGFSPNGKEYLIYLEPGQWTPAPWSNVVANDNFGFLITESGGGYSWAVNSGENRLTPWSNDPVSDMPGEAVYLRDEETAEVWSPTPLPARADAPYLIRHGAGYTEFEHNSHGLRQRLRLFAAPDDPVKVIQLRIENVYPQPRRITATYYAEWVLGVTREGSQQYIIPEYHAGMQALLAWNPYSNEFGQRVAFAAASRPLHGLTGSRTEFLGRLGSLAAPDALGRVGLGSVVEPGHDPCAALQLHIDLKPNEVDEFYFILGQGEDKESALRLVEAYQNPALVEQAWDGVQSLWDNLLGAVQVETPDLAMNLVLNRWLLYQALACRIWGRSAFYQSSGAYGFRDQLQDVMALVYTAPELTREHLLRAARHQFEAGDVLHWWHPPSGRGVRTRITDDLLWLPFVTAHYVNTTGDTSVLDEKVPFVKGPPLEPEQEDSYGHYLPTSETYTLYEHCRRALEKGTTSGRHGLPLIGTGDWNDGMNRVGEEGYGESVWLAWFLYACLVTFADICDGRGEHELAGFYRERAEKLSQAIEEHAWDGGWYLRAFYDDGTPLGSAQNRECKIDAIAQSWGVLSGAADPERALQAMRAVSEMLIRPEDRLLLLFTPPLDKTLKDPGYIKGYVPGIRENGGQYTHAAIWTVWALAQLGEGDQAEELFRILNPVYHADRPERVERYKVEPYVVAADIYSVPPHTSRGGWTWYTGSSGWLYRLGLEAILGLRRSGIGFWFEPQIPRHWPGFKLSFRQGDTLYQVQVDNSSGAGQGVCCVSLDGQDLPDKIVPFLMDGKIHQVQVELRQSGSVTKQE